MINYYILDLETTGLSPIYHEVTQISIIRVADKYQLNKYIKAEFPDRCSRQALDSTGRTIEDLSKGGTKQEAVEICNNFFSEDKGTAEQRCIVGHNIYNFDRGFLTTLWRSCNKDFPANLWFDTLSFAKLWAKKAGIQPDNFKLDSVLGLFGVQFKGLKHNAMYDTRNNYMLLEQLKKTSVPYLPHIKRFAHSEQE